MKWITVTNQDTKYTLGNSLFEAAELSENAWYWYVSLF